MDLEDPSTQTLIVKVKTVEEDYKLHMLVLVSMESLSCIRKILSFFLVLDIKNNQHT